MSASGGYVGPKAEELRAHDNRLCVCGHRCVSHGSFDAKAGFVGTGQGPCGFCADNAKAKCTTFRGVASVLPFAVLSIDCTRMIGPRHTTIEEARAWSESFDRENGGLTFAHELPAQSNEMGEES